MGTPYVGEIRMFGGNFAPAGWALCQGQTLAISENDVLFTLIGTTYGGDGQTTFNLPNLSSRVPLHMGTGGGSTYTLGQNGGVEAVTLTANQIPIHSHQMVASSDVASFNSPANNVTGQSPNKIYRVGSPSVTLAPTTIAQTGGSQPHDNMLPFLCINFIISLFGVFPSQT